MCIRDSVVEVVLRAVVPVVLLALALLALSAATAAALLAALVVALAATVALALPAALAVAALAVAATALGRVGGGFGLGVALRLGALLGLLLGLGLRLRLDLGLRLGLGVGAARLGRRAAATALARGLVVAGRLAGDVDLLLAARVLLGGGRLFPGARLRGRAALGLGLRVGGGVGSLGGRLGGGGSAARLRLLDDLDQLALAHSRGAPDAEAGRDLLQLGQDHAVEAGAGAAAPCGGARGSTFGGRGAVDVLVGSHAHQIGGVAHEGSFPGADVGLLARRPVVLSDCGLSILLDRGPCRGGGPPGTAER